MIARQHVLVEQTRDQIKREQNKLNLEEARKMKKFADATETEKVLMKEVGLNAAIINSDLKKNASAVNLEGNPIKRVG